MEENYLESVTKQFTYYKQLGDKTFNQLSEDQLFLKPYDQANSIAIIVKHLWGNMQSRWTDCLTTDGEKDWRNREEEFISDIDEKKELLEKWNEGWSTLFNALKEIKASEKGIEEIIYIRNIGHSVTEAINRQLAHYSYHIGQIVFIGTMLKGEEWQSLSIPKGDSKHYNSERFKKDKHRGHFTDHLIDKQ